MRGRGEIMLNRVIALRGVARIGKSNTIKKAYELLTSKYKRAVIEHQRIRTDITVILSINGVRVGIESQGDPNGRLGESLALFVKKACNVIICATRTSGQTFNAVGGLEQRGYEIVWFQQDVKANAAEQEPSNLVMARKILKKAEKVIGA
jgi:hypothetical protein